MCKTGSKLGQMTQIFGVGDAVSAKPRLGYLQVRVKMMLLMHPKFSEWEILVVQQTRDISLSRSAKRDE